VLGTIDELSPRLWLEAVRQGVRTAVRVVWLSDGGWGLWSVFQRLFQAVGVTAILDFYPAAQNLYKDASVWLDGRTRASQQWFADLRHRLRLGVNIVCRICYEGKSYSPEQIFHLLLTPSRSAR
jgi:hypothetical protein